MPKSTTAQAATSTSKGFVVRAGSYRSREVAEGEKNRLLQRGYPATLAVSTKTGASLYVIDVGPFPTKAVAETYLQSIRASVEKGAFLIEIPSGQKNTPISRLP